jgi:hypothetical protein
MSRYVLAAALPWLLVSHLTVSDCDPQQHCAPAQALPFTPQILGEFATRERCEAVREQLEPLWQQLVADPDPETPAATPTTGLTWKTTFACQLGGGTVPHEGGQSR